MSLQTEHLTPDRWLISNATRLPSQIIIPQYLESEHSCFSSVIPIGT